MARIQERRRQDGSKVYYVSIRRKGHPLLSGCFDRLTDARAWVAEQETEIRRGRFITQSDRKWTVAQMLHRYREEILPGKAASTRAVQALYLNWWEAEIGHLTLRDVTPEILRQALADLQTSGRGNGAVSVRRHFGTLRHCFNMALEWGWAVALPVSKVKLPAEPKGRLRFLDREELGRLLSACRESRSRQLFPAVVVSLATGVRRGELFKLTWDMVDLDRGHLTLPHSITKTRTTRGVPLTGEALAALREHARVRRLDNPLVFWSTRSGNTADLRSAFEEAVRRAGIADFHWHDLRHTAASYMIMTGASPATVAALLGHSSLQMTQRYAHLADDFLKAEVARMTDQLFKSKP